VGRHCEQFSVRLVRCSLGCSRTPQALYGSIYAHTAPQRLILAPKNCTAKDSPAIKSVDTPQRNICCQNVAFIVEYLPSFVGLVERPLTRECSRRRRRMMPHHVTMGSPCASCPCLNGPHLLVTGPARRYISPGEIRVRRKSLEALGACGCCPATGKLVRVRSTTYVLVQITGAGIVPGFPLSFGQSQPYVRDWPFSSLCPLSANELQQCSTKNDPQEMEKASEAPSQAAVAAAASNGTCHVLMSPKTAIWPTAS
jgi:hypothetical protein